MDGPGAGAAVGLEETVAMITLIKDVIKFVFGCNAPFSGGHDWVENEEKYHRTCEWCGREQMLVYHKFGSCRYEWVDSPMQRVKDMPELP